MVITAEQQMQKLIPPNPHINFLKLRMARQELYEWQLRISLFYRPHQDL